MVTWIVALALGLGGCTVFAVSRVAAQAKTRVPAPSNSNSKADSERDQDEYSREVEAAVAAYNQDDFPSARRHFARAHDLRPSARTWRGLGTTAFELKDYDEAVRELTFALEDKRAELPPPLREETEQTLGTARKKLAEREADARAEVTVEAPAAAVAAVAAQPEGTGVMSGQRIAALALGGMGVVGVAVGAGFGAHSLSKGAERDRLCPDPTPGCSSQAVRAADSALTSGTIATVAFVVGGVAIAGGVALWLTGAPSSRERQSAALHERKLLVQSASRMSLAATVGPGTLLLHGTF